MKWMEIIFEKKKWLQESDGDGKKKLEGKSRFFQIVF